MTAGDRLYVVARRALLDALTAAAPLRDSLILVGAQAVYLRSQRSNLALAPFTTDGDLVIDPSRLPSTPALEASLAAAGFSRGAQPGSWAKSFHFGGDKIDVDVDFMVPEAVAPGAGRRGVSLTGHDRLATRRVYGLEAALVDHSPIRITALEPSDHRAVTVEVAGPAALLIAKVHKISERVEAGRDKRNPVDKDAADVYRLLQTTAVAEMAAGLRVAVAADVSRKSAEEALHRLRALFGRPRAPGVEMATRAIGVSGEAPETIAAVLNAYVSALLSGLEGG